MNLSEPLEPLFCKQKSRPQRTPNEESDVGKNMFPFLMEEKPYVFSLQRMHLSFLTFFVGKRGVPEVQRGSKQVGKNNRV
jgi:hypothetical protein